MTCMPRLTGKFPRPADIRKRIEALPPPSPNQVRIAMARSSGWDGEQIPMSKDKQGEYSVNWFKPIKCIRNLVLNALNNNFLMKAYFVSFTNQELHS